MNYEPTLDWENDELKTYLSEPIGQTIGIGQVIRLMRTDVKNAVESVASRGEIITYGTIMNDFDGISRGRSIANVLDEISNDSFSQHGILLSAIVVSKESRDYDPERFGYPNKGFFELRDADGAYRGARERYWVADQRRKDYVRQEQRKVWAHYRTHNP